MEQQLGTLAGARVLLVEGAEALGMVPRGTHHWDDFITPDELRELLAVAGLAMGEPRGEILSRPMALRIASRVASGSGETARTPGSGAGDTALAAAALAAAVAIDNSFCALT